MDFSLDSRPPKWEFAYWGGTLSRWYEEGLPKKHYVSLPPNITTPTSSLYLTAFKSNEHKLLNGRIPEGLAVCGGGLYWPTQGFPLERDVEEHLGLDKGIRLIDVNLLFYPMFEPSIESEDDDFLTYNDIDGCKRVFQKNESTIPHTKEWVIKDVASWSRLKEERLKITDLDKRFPDNWEDLVKEYKSRDYPLAIGGYPHGLFGLPAHLMGYENLFYAYYDEPEMIHDMLDTFTDLWIEMYDRVFSCVDVDMLQIFEDLSMNKAPMISPAIFDEFLAPRYRKLTDFVKSRGVKNILLDTDGDCYCLISRFLQNGITGLYPMEVSAGMDIFRARKDFPKLQMMGGIPKMEIAKGRARIDELLADVRQLLKYGGYIPFLDHSVPPNVSWEDFKYYRSGLNATLDEYGR